MDADGIAPIPTQETAGPPHSRVGRWMFAGQRMDAPEQGAHATHPWYLVLWLTENRPLPDRPSPVCPALRIAEERDSVDQSRASRQAAPAAR